MFLASPIDTVSVGPALVLGTAGLPHILMRFLSVPNAKAARRPVVLGDACAVGIERRGPRHLVEHHPQSRDIGQPGPPRPARSWRLAREPQQRQHLCLTVAAMTDLAECERVGDLDGPFQRTAMHERAQRVRERLREALRCDVPPLTYEEYRTGTPCPGCGLPYQDEDPWELRGTVRMTRDERARYEAEEQRYKALHGSCGSHRHSVSGSLTMHCGKCCPAPPLSPSQIKQIGRILGNPTPPHMLMRWQLRLYCGHVIEKRAHYTHKTLHAAFTGMIACSECSLNPATIVDGAAIGLAGEPPARKAPLCAPSRPERNSKPESENSKPRSKGGDERDTRRGARRGGAGGWRSYPHVVLGYAAVGYVIFIDGVQSAHASHCRSVN
jgi:hypothetical protein